MQGQIVDVETAEEFMRETLEKVSPEILSEIALELRAKSTSFGELLSAERLASPSRGDLRRVLRATFSARKRADTILDELGVIEFSQAVEDLLRGSDDLPTRFERFQFFLTDFPAACFELPSELLHFTYPDQYWLWTRWMWDSKTETGSLALVTDDEFDFEDESSGITYMKVGQAIAFVSETGRSAKFAAFDDGPFNVDIFLACVYAVYMYTVLRLRMTQEFNRIVPQQPELVRRLLGVHRMED